jgi:hypothetical protein
MEAAVRWLFCFPRLCLLSLCLLSLFLLLTGSLSPTPALSQGYGYGTAVVVLRSSEVLLAAVDSKEIYRDYRDGEAVVDERTACKLTSAGPYYAIVAGLSHGTNGFDALKEAAQSYTAGDGLGEMAARAERSVPRLLVPLLKAIQDSDPADFARRYRGRTVLQLSLMGLDRGTGRDNGSPRVVVLEFIEKEAAPGYPGLSTRTASCPGDCPDPTAAYFLGTHDKIDEAVARDGALIRPPTESRVEKLIGFEYLDRPDLVGGPLSILRIGKSGGTILRPGVCSFN